MMRERWIFNGWELTEGVARDWEYREGTNGVAAPVGTESTVPNRTGVIWRPKTFGPGEFTLSVWLAGADQSGVHAAWRNLIRAVARPHRLSAVSRTLASGEVLTCDAQLAGKIEPTFLGQRGYRAQLGFQIPKGFWRSQVAYTDSTTAGAALTQYLDLTHFEPSTAPMENLICEVKGPISFPVVEDYTDGVVGDGWSYSGIIAAGDSLIVNSATWAISGTGGLVPKAASVTPTGPRFLTVPAALPGQKPRVRLRGSNGGTGTQLIVTGPQSHHC